MLEVKDEANLAAELVVGCALLPKKCLRYLTPKMMQTAALHNIQLKQIDYTRSLIPQGPFDVIVHKLRPNPAWEQFLQEYKAAHPEVCIIDRLDRIKALQNRSTMLTPLKGEGITLSQPLQPQQEQQQQPQLVRVQAPLQVEIPEGATDAEAQAALTAAGLSPPLLCKPLWTDGREGSHGLAVLHDLEELGRLLRGGVASEFKPPLVVQQFVEHGGVLFKVYVLGSQTVVTARPSLGEHVLEAEQGVQQLPRISCVSVFGKHLQRQLHQQQQQQECTAAAAVSPCSHPQQQATGRGCNQQQQLQQVQPSSPPQSQPQQQQQQQQRLPAGSPPRGLAAVAAAWKPPPTAACPPEWVTTALAATLRRELGMQLFNFDLIIPEQQLEGEGQADEQQQEPGEQAAPPLCYVVDINYFPGVDKIVDFEQRFVALLWEVAREHQQRQLCKRQRQQQDHDQQQQQLPPVAATTAAEPFLSAMELDRGCSSSCSVAATKQQGAVQQQQQRQPASAAARSNAAGSQPLPRPPSLSRHSFSGGSSTASGSSSSTSGLAAYGSGALAELQLGGSCNSSPSGLHHHHHHRHHRHSHGGMGVDVAGGAGQWADPGVMGSSPPLQVAGCS